MTEINNIEKMTYYRKDNGCIYNEKRDGDFVEKEYTLKPQPDLYYKFDEEKQAWIIDEEKGYIYLRPIICNKISEIFKYTDRYRNKLKDNFILKKMGDTFNEDSILTQDEYDYFLKYCESLRVLHKLVNLKDEKGIYVKFDINKNKVQEYKYLKPIKLQERIKDIVNK